MAEVELKSLNRVDKEISKLEKEINNSEWTHGWEKGREDLIRDLEKSLFPDVDSILKSAEIIIRLLEKRFGKVFENVFAGYNSYYDEPAILVCLKDDVDCKRSDVCMFGVILEQAFSDLKLLPLNLMVTRSRSTDYNMVKEEFSFERNNA